MGWAHGNHLQKLGLLNTHVGDLRDYQESLNKDKRGTFCNSFCANGNNQVKYGVLVHVGERYLDECPECGGKKLYHETVSPKRADRFHYEQSLKKG